MTGGQEERWLGGYLPPAPGDHQASATDDIADAIRDHDWPRVEALLHALLVTDPVQAQAVYDTIQLGLEVGRAAPHTYLKGSKKR